MEEGFFFDDFFDDFFKVEVGVLFLFCRMLCDRGLNHLCQT